MSSSSSIPLLELSRFGVRSGCPKRAGFAMATFLANVFDFACPCVKRHRPRMAVGTSYERLFCHGILLGKISSALMQRSSTEAAIILKPSEHRFVPHGRHL